MPLPRRRDSTTWFTTLLMLEKRPAWWQSEKIVSVLLSWEVSAGCASPPPTPHSSCLEARALYAIDADDSNGWVEKTPRLHKLKKKEQV
eukprot:CAMPEP_0175976294 /NCGR_PEP_ID=MMETSP0108-20121206/44439_1 /TAXON_ID=195067 ORGANISM="Goniomonas pacifica, Strain CCMP1869" /NCGR_SAMPLE_ID=MMETSP0108 /ASSEMBLY_ACC=CAM_ASM_000204 /LENGTH=88 /DNA_ID=CAMNT_0017306175 /DNA_START=993 /DNA_END=1259 /DNA_ORIENTATION=-